MPAPWAELPGPGPVGEYTTGGWHHHAALTTSDRAPPDAVSFTRPEQLTEYTYPRRSEPMSAVAQAAETVPERHYTHHEGRGTTPHPRTRPSSTEN